MSQELQAMLTELYPLVPNASADNVIQTFAPMSAQDIINQLKSPYSRLRQDMNAYISNVFVEEQMHKQQLYLQRIELEREQIQVLSQQSQISPVVAANQQKMLDRFEATTHQNLDLLLKLQVQTGELSELYEKYNNISKELIELEKNQRDDVNNMINKLGLEHPEKHLLTEEKQAKIHDIFEATEEYSKKLERGGEMSLSEAEKDEMNRSRFMGVLMGENISNADMRILAKAGNEIYDGMKKTEGRIADKTNELRAQLEKITQKENEISQTMGQINQNSAHLAPVLTMNLSSAKTSKALEEMLKSKYDVFEKNTGKGSEAQEAFRNHLNIQLRQMSPDERQDFFSKTKNFNPRDEKELQINSALNNLRAQQYPQQSLSSTAPTPFDAKPG